MKKKKPKSSSGKLPLWPSKEAFAFAQSRSNFLKALATQLFQMGVWVKWFGKERMYWFEPYVPTIRTLHVKALCFPTPITPKAPFIVEVGLDLGNPRMGRDLTVWRLYGRDVSWSRLRANHFRRPRLGAAYIIDWPKLDAVLAHIRRNLAGAGEGVGTLGLLDPTQEADVFGRSYLAYWQPGQREKFEAWQEEMRKMSPGWLKRRLRRWARAKANKLKPKEGT